MRGKKTKMTDKAKVIKAKLEDPEASLRDITKKTGINHVTSQEIIKSIPKELTGSNKGLTMVDKLDDIINDIVQITKNNLVKYKKDGDLETRELRDLSAIAKDNFERKQILTGQPTEIKNLNFDLGVKSLKELEDFRNTLLK